MATTPEPDEKAAGGLQALAAWLKQYLLTTFGLVGAAMTLFGSLEPFLDLANFAQFLVEHWREWTHGVWQWLATLVSLHIPAKWADFLTYAVFIAAITLKSRRIMDKKHHLEIAVYNNLLKNKNASPEGAQLQGWKLRQARQNVIHEIVHIYRNDKKFLFVTLFWLMSAFLIVHLNYYVLGFFALGTIFYIVIFSEYIRKFRLVEFFSPLKIPMVIGISISYDVFVRLSILLVILICLNYIGIYSDLIETWIEKVTA